MSAEPTWRIKERLIEQAESSIEARASFEKHVRRSTKPLLIEVDPRDLLRVLKDERSE